jgi:hypothetical protein
MQRQHNARTRLENPSSLIIQNACYWGGRDSDITFLYCGGKRMLIQGRGMRFFIFSFSLASHAYHVVNLPEFFCLIFTEVGISLFCCLHLLDKIYILLI